MSALESLDGFGTQKAVRVGDDADPEAEAVILAVCPACAYQRRPLPCASRAPLEIYSFDFAALGEPGPARPRVIELWPCSNHLAVALAEPGLIEAVILQCSVSRRVPVVLPFTSEDPLMTTHSPDIFVAPRRADRTRSSRPLGGPLVVGAGVVAALAASAYVNHRKAKEAEHENPPIGRFLTVDGMRLHYLERGTGTPLVLLHGNGGMIQDFLSSGLVDRAAERYRVIVFDRPGYGYSDRPRSRVWTAEAQADLLAQALRQLGVRHAVVLGHSWACSVAVSLAHEHPDLVAGLVLEGGYFYPSARLDVWPMSLSAIPVLGDILRYTVSPPLSRALWPLMMRKIFGPDPEPPKFRGFPRGMALRPSQLRASAEESALMIPGAIAAQGTYEELTQPIAIVAGDDDRMVSTEQQSARLNRDVPKSTFLRVPDRGHMVHHTATEAVLEAVDRVTAAI